MAGRSSSNPRGVRVGAGPSPTATRRNRPEPRPDEAVADPTLPRHWVDHAIHRRRALSTLVLSATGASDQLDPHPDLLRAARHHGEATPAACPWCRSEALVLLRYVYSDELGPFSGRLRTEEGISEWATEYGFLDVYVVEVCPDCRWNHLLHTYVVGDGHQREPRRAPADLLE